MKIAVFNDAIAKDDIGYGLGRDHHDVSGTRFTI
jgi:hypothetical protein